MRLRTKATPLVACLLMLTPAAFAAKDWTADTVINGSITVLDAKLCETVVHTSSITDSDKWTEPSDSGTDPDTITYAWTKSVLTNPQSGTFTGATNLSTVSWEAPPCTGTVTITLTADDLPKAVVAPDTGTRDDSSIQRSAASTVSLPAGCSAGTKSATLQLVETGNPDCPGNPAACGRTHSADTVTVTATVAKYSNNTCKWVFQVTSTGNSRSDPCPTHYTEITDGADADIVVGNFCALVNGFSTGCCFGTVGNAYGNSPIIETHEDVHFTTFHDRLQGAETALLLPKASMELAIVCADAGTKTCAAAVATRQAAITADVNTAYSNAWIWTVLQGEAAAEAAEFPASTLLAKAICLRAKNEPTWDVDTCAQCVAWGYTD